MFYYVLLWAESSESVSIENLVLTYCMQIMSSGMQSQMMWRSWTAMPAAAAQMRRAAATICRAARCTADCTALTLNVDPVLLHPTAVPCGLVSSSVIVLSLIVYLVTSAPAGGRGDTRAPRSMIAKQAA